MTPYQEFTKRLTLLIRKNPHLITTTLSNIFTLRLIGNKTHGDLAEIAIVEFINQYMYDFKSVHVGKSLFRSKEHEEDVSIINEITRDEFPVSLKAYGDGPLQLSTDKNSLLFPTLQKFGNTIDGAHLIGLWNEPGFAEFGTLNVLPLIYDERRLRCNILVFDQVRAKAHTARVTLHKGPKHQVYRFYDAADEYICEVRYGGATANALQRGIWTNTRKGLKYFDSVTDGWIEYSHSPVLVKMFSHALLATSDGHEKALNELKKDIESQKKKSSLGIK